MKNFSTPYIYMYVIVLVTVIAISLTAVSLGLKPRREFNQRVEKAQQILQAAGYGKVPKEMAVAKFDTVTQIIDNQSTECYQIHCADGTTGRVVAVHGNGLWGPIWGYVVLTEDLNTIKGVVFAHKSETPGLGDKITEEAFTSQFIGKKLHNAQSEYTSVRVLPKGKNPTVAPENRVDAISGATLTSKGVDAMIMQSFK